MDNDDARLSRISTQWALVFQAHQGRTTEVRAAQLALMLRYGGAVHRYLLGALRDPEVAEELDQEFALRFLRGDFHRADQTKGRFRDFVKRALSNLVIDHYRRRGASKARPLSDLAVEPAAPTQEPAEFDHQFLASWREQMMEHAWERLKALEDQTGQPHHAVLRFRADHPEMRSPEIAQRLGERLGKPVTAGWVRQSLHVARDHFVGFLLEEVESTLDHPSDEDVEEELIALRLLEFCRPALNRKKPRPERGKGPSSRA